MTSPVEQMSDYELIAWCSQAKEDLEDAATNQPQSDWHATCFAALYQIACEMNRRGLKAVD